jgi:predicted  nucleic acid-binding Zn-ribbon protein
MEPTVTLSLSQYEQMKNSLEHYKKALDSRITLTIQKYHSRPYGGTTIDESHRYTIDKDHLPDIYKELATQLEECKESHQRLHEEILKLHKKYAEAVQQIVDLKEKAEEAPTLVNSTTNKKKWYQF